MFKLLFSFIYDCDFSKFGRIVETEGVISNKVPFSTRSRGSQIGSTCFDLLIFSIKEKYTCNKNSMVYTREVAVNCLKSFICCCSI